MENVALQMFYEGKKKLATRSSELKNPCCGVRWETYKKATLGCYYTEGHVSSLPISVLTTAPTNNSAQILKKFGLWILFFIYILHNHLPILFNKIYLK